MIKDKTNLTFYLAAFKVFLTFLQELVLSELCYANIKKYIFYRINFILKIDEVMHSPPPFFVLFIIIIFCLKNLSGQNLSFEYYFSIFYLFIFP